MKTTLVRSVRWALIALLSAGLLAYVRRIPWTSALATMQHASFEAACARVVLSFSGAHGQGGHLVDVSRAARRTAFHDRCARHAHGGDAQ